jgi:solute:Na+ symporter, SSS family
MTTLSTFDYGIIAGFLVIILFVGLIMSRQASKNLEHYFLGGRNIPWYLLGITGMSTWFDLTGTMIITSFLYMMGPLGLYVEFRGGAVLALAFMLAYAAKWTRRSGCMTAAEFASYRYGTGFSGELLRLVSAWMGIITTIGMLAFLVRGATLFMAMVFPVDPVLLTLALLGLASLYTVLAGFYGIVLTDLVQGAIMVAGSVTLSVIAWHQFADMGALQQMAAKVTGNANWAASLPSWHVDMPRGYEAYENLLMAAFFYFVRSCLGGMASVGSPLHLAARNSREASMQCLVQGATVMFRWPLMISLAILGIYLVAKILPDNQTAEQVAAIVKEANPTLSANNWHTYTSNIVHHPETAPPGVVEKIQAVLGDKWQPAFMLVGFNGTVNPELILPAVIINSLQSGLRGILVVCLLAALMSTLTGTVNGASALFVRDVYQNFLRRSAGNRELIGVAYVSSAVIILSSFFMGLAVPSINDLWSWLVMGLLSGVLGPSLCGLYWWRTNAWGIAAGIFAGGVAAILQRIFVPQLSEWWQFGCMTSISLGATVVVSYLTPETPRDVVRYFFRTTRPFGFWGPLRSELPAEERRARTREHRIEAASVFIALAWQISLFMLPMQFLTHNFSGLLVTGPIFLVASFGLYFVWWRNLPSADEVVADFASRPPLAHDPLTIDAAKAEVTTA